MKRPIITGLLVGCGVVAAGITPVVAQPPQPLPAKPAAPPAPAEPPTQAVNVRINGEALPFAGQGAVQRGGAVLVPLRGIFEKLGAAVKYDAVTGAITAVKLDTTISLKVGDTTGYINGMPRPLTTPATIYNGAVLIPLRLVSDAFGATIGWDSQNMIADITTDAINAVKLPTPPADDSNVGGILTGVYPEINAVTVRVVTSDNTRVLLSRETEVQIRQVGTPKERATLNDLRIGDQIVIRRNRAGFANVIQVLRDLRRGVIKEKKPLDNGNTQILFTNGAMVELSGRAPILQNGKVVELSDVRLNEGIVVRINLENGVGISAAVITTDDPTPIPPDADAQIEEVKPPIPTDTGKPANPNPIPPPAAMPKPEVSMLTHDAAGKTLKMGDMINFTLTGTPGGKAVITVAGLINAKELALTEKPDMPGTYMGQVAIPAGVGIKDASLTATLTVGDQTSTMTTAADKISVDSTGPEISATGPANEAVLTETKPKIYGAFNDPQSKVDPQGVRILLNGIDITAKVDLTEAFFTYKPAEDLASGKYVVTIIAKDTLGNESRKEFEFTVAPPEKPVRTIAVSPKQGVLRADEQVNIRMEGIRGGMATFKIGPMSEVPMQESSPGVYTGTYIVKKGDVLTKAPVVVLFSPPNQGQMTVKADEVVTFAAGAPIAPIIDFPSEGVTARGGYVVFSGRAAPDVKVRIRVRYTGKNMVKRNVEGSLDTYEVETDANGNWKSKPVLLNVPKDVADLQFVAEIVAVRDGGETSGPAIVRFKKL